MHSEHRSCFPVCL
uniref:Uncharacterized protein n=1 Tax=Anguilla anguilla TaxID=7936 RepID=A0A0E9PY45_ANGAN